MEKVFWEKGKNSKTASNQNDHALLPYEYCLGKEGKNTLFY